MFSNEIIKERYTDAFVLAQNFLEKVSLSSTTLGMKTPVSFSINRRRLFLAVSSTYQDIYRYKKYHQEDTEESKLDATKRGAYLVKWIMRFKPIDAKLEDNFEPDLSAETAAFDVFENINEHFAVNLCEEHLSLELGATIQFSVDKTYELVYNLLYREINSDGWIAILKLMKESHEAIDTVPFMEHVGT